MTLPTKAIRAALLARDFSTVRELEADKRAKKPKVLVSSSLRRGKGLSARTTRIATKKRSTSEFRRIYGSKARVAWVKSLPCVVTGHRFCGITPVMCGGEIENAHTANGGTGRKADAETIVPMCSLHHHTLHAFGVETFEASYRVKLREEATRLAAEWDAMRGAA